MAYSTIDVIGTNTSTQFNTSITVTTNRNITNNTTNTRTTTNTNNIDSQATPRRSDRGIDYSASNTHHRSHNPTGVHSDDVLHSLSMLKSANQPHTSVRRTPSIHSEPSLSQLPSDHTLEHSVSVPVFPHSTHSDNDSELPGSESLSSDIDTHIHNNNILHTHTDTDISILNSPIHSSPDSMHHMHTTTVPNLPTAPTQSIDTIYVDQELDDTSMLTTHSTTSQNIQHINYPTLNVPDTPSNTSHYNDTDTTQPLQPPTATTQLTYPTSYLSNLDPSGDYPFKTSDGTVQLYCIGKVNLQLKDQNCRRGGAKAATLRFDIHNVSADHVKIENNSTDTKQYTPVELEEHKQHSAPLPLLTPPNSPGGSHNSTHRSHTSTHNSTNSNTTVRILLESKLYSKKGFFNKYAKYVRGKYGVTLISADCAYFAVEENKVKDLVMMSTANKTDARNPRHALQVDTPYSVYFFATNKSAWIEHTNTEKHADVEVVVSSCSGNVVLKQQAAPHMSTPHHPMLYQQHRPSHHQYSQPMQYSPPMQYNSYPDMHYPPHPYNTPYTHYGTNHSPDNGHYPRSQYPTPYNTNMSVPYMQPHSHYMQPTQPYIQSSYTAPSYQPNTQMVTNNSANTSPTTYYHTFQPTTHTDTTTQSNTYVDNTNTTQSTPSATNNNFANVLLAAAANSQSSVDTSVATEHQASVSPGQLNTRTSILSSPYPTQRTTNTTTPHTTDAGHNTVLDDSMLRDVHSLHNTAEYFNNLPHRFTSTSSQNSIKRKLLSSGSSGFNSPPHVSHSPSTGSIDSQQAEHGNTAWTPHSVGNPLEWNTAKRLNSTSAFDNVALNSNTAGQPKRQATNSHMPQQPLYQNTPHQLQHVYKQQSTGVNDPVYYQS